MPSSNRITLGYWNIHGLAQPIRLLLAYTKTDFVDHMPSRPEWAVEKAENAYGLEFPNLPYFVDGDVKLSQSSAIMRHL
jgi:glutathione S-transferase